MNRSLRQRLAALPPLGPPSPSPHQRCAAVLIAVLEQEADCPVIFTRRATRLRQHAGEICLPGGLMEPADNRCVIRTALREAHEELGLSVSPAAVRAVLPACDNSSGVRVYPVLARVTRPRQWRLQASEVADVLELPLAAFMDAGQYQHQEIEYRGRRKTSLVLSYRGERIWGLTARIMDRLRQRLPG
ncbi:coenzyme A pyrophosphatase [Alcanivorax sp. N3-2A]|nr:coenzyme A pyrophosphatase [Alcanivorax sp. N3-2A]|tara:strand:+ start:21078 stop:21641 length:564 start_codon:yes stop_codon:yes gene_type:complete